MKTPYHLSAGVPLPLMLLVKHGRVQRQPAPRPVLAGEHHHGRLHPGDGLAIILHHVARRHREPVSVRVPGLQPVALAPLRRTKRKMLLLMLLEL